MTPACVFESPWESGNLSVCFTVTIKIVKNKKNSNIKNTKKHQNPKPKKNNKTKHQTTKTKNRIPSILEGDTFFLKDKKINRTVTVATHFSKDLQQ